jgi:hypothetical protein
LKNDSVQTQGDLSPSTKLANCSENTRKLQKARERLMAAGRQAFSLVTWNIFRPHDFPLTSGNINAAPVNYPVLVKTSDQLSFSSSDFSPFTSVEAFRSTDISSVPSLN